MRWWSTAEWLCHRWRLECSLWLCEKLRKQLQVENILVYHAQEIRLLLYFELYSLWICLCVIRWLTESESDWCVCVWETICKKCDNWPFAKAPPPLVTVASPTSFLTPTECQHSVMSGKNIAVRVSDSFWSNTCAISSRSRQKGLQYAVEGYIKNIKINKEGDTTTVEAKAYRSMAKSEKPHDLYLTCNEHSLLDQLCSCTAG